MLTDSLQTSQDSSVKCSLTNVLSKSLNQSAEMWCTCSDTVCLYDWCIAIIVKLCTIIYIHHFNHFQGTRPHSWPCIATYVRRIFWFSLNCDASNLFLYQRKMPPVISPATGTNQKTEIWKEPKGHRRAERLHHRYSGDNCRHVSTADSLSGEKCRRSQLLSQKVYLYSAV